MEITKQAPIAVLTLVMVGCGVPQAYDAHQQMNRDTCFVRPREPMGLSEGGRGAHGHCPVWPWVEEAHREGRGLAACTSTSGAREPEVFFKVDRDGTASFVTVTDAETDEEDCLVRMVRAWSFDPAEEPMLFRVYVTR